MLKIFALVAALAAVVLPQAAHAQVTTGQSGVCCAYINDPTTRTGWQLVCNKPALVSHHQPNGRWDATALFARLLCTQLPPPTPHSVSGSSQVAGTILTSDDAAFHIHSRVCPWVDMPHQYTVAAAATAAGSRPDHRP